MLVCGMERLVAEPLLKWDANSFGDLIFALGIPIVIKSLKGLHRAAAI